MSFLKKQNFCLYAFEFRERKSRNYEYQQWEYEQYEQFMFHSYFERKNDKALIFDVVHFSNFEISASLLLAPPSNKRRTS